MTRILRKYLDQVIVYANRDEQDSVQILAELEDHLLKKISDLEAQGFSHEDAVFSAIEDHGSPRTVGYGLRKHRWLDVRTQGTARGFIAIGPKAIGVVAVGGIAVGLLSCGIFAIGLISFSIVGIALLMCYGAALAVAPLGLAHGSVAVGFIAAGFWSCGILAIGPQAFGLYIQHWYRPEFSGQTPYPVVYLYALTHSYVLVWGGLAASFVFHSLVFAASIALGSALCWRRFRSEQRQIGYTVLRF